MDKRECIRWAVLLSALAATVAAVVYPAAENGAVGVSGAAPHVARAVEATSQVMVDAAGGEAGESPADASDPFAPRGWQAPPPSAPPAPVAQQLAVAPVVLAPAGPPALPFRFVGNFSDGAEQVVYLARGEQAIVARLGDVIDTNYKVVGVSPAQIEFEYLPTGDKQPLVFPAHDN